MRVNYEDFPKKCIKCKEQVDLEKFRYSRSRRPLFRNTTTTYYVNFPVCNNCKNSFNSYLRLENLSNWFLYYGGIGSIILFIIALLLSFSGMIGTSGNMLIFLSIILFVGSAIMSIIFNLLSRIHPGKISNFIKINKKGIVTLKDQDLQDEFSMVAEKNLIERIKGPDPSEAITCPKCNALQKSGADFCLNCGKNLRIVNV